MTVKSSAGREILVDFKFPLHTFYEMCGDCGSNFTAVDCVPPHPSLPPWGGRGEGAKGAINAATAGRNLLLLLPRSHLCHASACDHCQRPRGHWGGGRQKRWGVGGVDVKMASGEVLTPIVLGPRWAGEQGVGGRGECVATSSGAWRP